MHGTLPSSVVLRIAGTLPPRADAGEDRIIWGFSDNGSFSTKTAYQSLLHHERDQDRPLWRVIWRAPAPQRARTLLWLVAKDRLLTNVERLRRHILVSEACDLCGEPKSVLHVVRDCPTVKDLWKRLVPKEYTRRFFQHPIKQWIMSNLLYQQIGTGTSWSSVFVITVWCSWKWRNEQIFKNAKPSSEAKRLCDSEGSNLCANLIIQSGYQQDNRGYDHQGGRWRFNGNSRGRNERGRGSYRERGGRNDNEPMYVYQVCSKEGHTTNRCYYHYDSSYNGFQPQKDFNARNQALYADCTSRISN
ncbi:Polynucleotidyl transferase- ribonuclease H-like superfamily protein [Striga hermonthica]|uniref:Polynucleotidyl transferase- ribonuclease H-like superfamily protein n=1 Tax=Striga hermonthica TaxID=68872 RepID=A0A9N7P0B4_STRHE|nr:Polynucleotidyl transferase- ribonuclease H-like superfamily protein [Striga hermonthica]